MGILNKFEDRLEKLIEGLFSSLSASAHPVQVADKLAKSMRENTRRTLDKQYAPAFYEVHLSPEDAEVLSSLGSELKKELAEFLESAADEEGITFSNSPEIAFIEDKNAAGGQIKVKSIWKTKPQWRLRANGTDVSYGLGEDGISVGRSSDNIVVIPSPRVSRQHARLELRSGKAWVKDLDSTNGTFVNGEKVDSRELDSGSIIKFAEAEFVIENL